MHDGRVVASAEVAADLLEHLRTKARWEKAVQHLAEAGVLEDSPRDIGKIIKEIPADIEKEMKSEISEVLWKHFWPQIRRGANAGVAEWYKERLAEGAFVE